MIHLVVSVQTFVVTLIRLYAYVVVYYLAVCGRPGIYLILLRLTI